jgi:hypothetical protein
MTLAAFNHEHATLFRKYTRQNLHLTTQLLPLVVTAKVQVVKAVLNNKIFLFFIYFGPLQDSHRGRRFADDDELKHNASE